MTKLKQGTLTVFLCSMQPNHMFSNRRAVRVGDSEEEDEEEAKLHERENELKILQKYYQRNWASSSHNVLSHTTFAN